MVAMGVPAGSVDDAAHDVLEILVRRIEDYDDRYSLRQWMSGVARRVAKTHRQRAARERIELPEIEAGPRSNPERHTKSREDAALLDRFLEELDPDKWAVFVLSEIEGLRGSEIAAEIDVNLNTVYARLRAARTQLDRVLARRRARERRWLGLVIDRLLPPGGAPTTTAAFVAVKGAVGIAIGMLALAVVWWAMARASAPESPVADPSASAAAPTASVGPRLDSRPAVSDDTREKAATIEGRVVDPDGAGLPHADVCAWPTGLLRDAVGPRCTRADDNGRYALENLRAAEILVSAGAHGFRPGHVSEAPWTPPLRVGPGERRSGIDIVLQPGGAEITGRIVDATGGPIPGARVLADRGFTPQSRPHRGVFVAADGEGRFSIWTSPGTAAIRIEASNYVSTTRHVSAPTHDLEVRLVPGARLTGVVVAAESGRTLPGAVVEAVALDDGATKRGTTISTSDGRFDLDGLMPGRYTVSATAPGRAGVGGERVVVGLGETVGELRIEAERVASVMAEVVTEEGEPCRRGQAALTARGSGARYVFPIESDGTVGFWALEDAGIYDPVVMCETHIPLDAYPPVVADGEPIEGLRWVVVRGGTITGHVERADPLDDTVWVRAAGLDADRAANVPLARDGSFALEGLSPGRYVVRAAGLHHPPSQPIEVVLPADGSVDGVDIELGAGATIRGTIRDERGAAVVGARVDAHGRARVHYAPAYTAHDGSYAITGLPAGRYRLAASRSGDERPVPSSSVTVALEDETIVDLRLPPHDATIRGVVVDEDRSPVPDAFVLAWPKGSDASTDMLHRPVITEVDGTFELDGLAAVPHTVQAHRPGGGTVTETPVEPGSDVRLSIPPMGSFSGSVRRVDGRIPAWVTLEARRKGDARRRIEFLEDERTWSIPELPPGTYTLTATSMEGAATIEGLVLEPGGHIDDLELELGARVRVIGRVVDLETGEPIPDMAIVVSSRSEPAPSIERWPSMPGIQRTGADGSFEVRDVVPGRVWVAGRPLRPDVTPYAGFRMPETIPAEGDATLAAIRLPRRPRPISEMQRVTFGFELDADDLWGANVEPRMVLRSVTPELTRAGARPGDIVLAIEGHDVTGRNTYLVESFLRALPGTTVRLDLQGGTTLTAPAAPFVAP